MKIKNAMVELHSDNKKKRTLRFDDGMIFSTAGTGCFSVTSAAILLLYFKPTIL